MTQEDNINFGEIKLNSNENVESNNFSKNENIIGKINENIDNNETNTIDLDSIKIDEVKQQIKKNVNFDNEEVQQVEKKHYHINYRKTFIISFCVISVTIIVSLGLNLYNNYITSYSLVENEIEDNKLIEQIKKIKNFVESYFSKDHGISSNVDFVGENGEIILNSLIKSKINYIQKKEIINDSLKILTQSVISNHKDLENLKKSITKDGFFSADISNIISNEEQISSIQNSLLSLEAIKFSSAINVFPHLDTFLEGLSNTNNMSKTQIEEQVSKIIQRGENDINLYIRNCYLNPFEINYNCQIIGDFEKYYTLTNDKNFDTQFFKDLIKYADIKLEQTELPSFSIDFKKFDKNSNQITFDIDINTFKQDEIELAKKGILSPHVFILNNLINNLKQSRFILGRGITVNTLKVEPKTIDIGTTEFTINNSNKTFTVDIQKESEREIDDFVSIEF